MGRGGGRGRDGVGRPDEGVGVGAGGGRSPVGAPPLGVVAAPGAEWRGRPWQFAR